MPDENLIVTNTATVVSGALLVLASGGGFAPGTLANSGEVLLNGPTATLGGAGGGGTSTTRA